MNSFVHAPDMQTENALQIILQSAQECAQTRHSMAYTLGISLFLDFLKLTYFQKYFKLFPNISR